MKHGALKRCESLEHALSEAIEAANSGQLMELYTPHPFLAIERASRLARDCERVKGTWDLVFDSGGILRIRDVRWGLPEQSKEAP